MEKLHFLGRFVAIAAGIALIVIGVRYATLLFDQIYNGVTDPTTVAQTLNQWSRLLVSDLDSLPHNDALGKVEHIRIIALIVIAVGGLLLTWLTIHLIVAGAKVVQIATFHPNGGKGVAAPAPPATRAAPPPAQKVKKEPKYNPMPPRQKVEPRGKGASPGAPEQPNRG